LWCELPTDGIESEELNEIKRKIHEFVPEKRISDKMEQEMPDQQNDIEMHRKSPDQEVDQMEQEVPGTQTENIFDSSYEENPLYSYI
jgi:hypothetical protein